MGEVDESRVATLRWIQSLEKWCTLPSPLLKAGFNRSLFWEVWKARMAVFGF